MRNDSSHSSTLSTILSASRDEQQLWLLRLINLNYIVTSQDVVLQKHVVVCLNYTITKNPICKYEDTYSLFIILILPYFYSWNILYVSPLLDSAHILTWIPFLCIYTQLTIAELLTIAAAMQGYYRALYKSKFSISIIL